MDSRGVSAVVEKVVAIGLVTLFVTGFGVALYGGVVPDYRASAADELAERSLAAVADGVETTVPASGATVNASRSVSVPPTIAGATYRFELDNRTVRLRHPDPALGGTSHLSIPAGVAVETGTAPAGEVRIVVRGPGGNRTVALE